MIFREIPNISDLDAPCPVWRWPNMIIAAKVSKIRIPEHKGPLSIKCAFGGEEVYETEGSRHVVNDESYLVLNDGQRYSCRIDSESPVEIFCVFFRPGFADEILTNLVTSEDKLLNDPWEKSEQPITFFDKIYPHDDLLTPGLLRLRTLVHDGWVPDSWFDEELYQVLEQLLTMHRSMREDIAKLPGAKASTRAELYRRLHRAKDYIDASLDQTIGLADVAKVACLSQHHFLRSFKKAFGFTPHQYLIERRMDRVQHLLSTTSKSITDICFELGFESLGSFSWLFRKRVGMSPERYRAKLMNNSSK